MNLTKVIDDAIKGFNFKNVETYMRLVDWKHLHYNKKGKAKYVHPTAKMLKKHVKNLCNDMLEHDTGEIASGGFVVRRISQENTTWITIQFIAEENAECFYDGNEE